MKMLIISLLLNLLLAISHEPIELNVLKESFLSKCTKRGIIYPTPANGDEWDLFEARDDLFDLLGDSSHPLSRSLCRGPQAIDAGEAVTFHASWECYDSGPCLLPTVNVKTLQTLVHHHPQGRVIIWSNSLTAMSLVQVGSDQVEIQSYDESLFEDLPPAAHEASMQIPRFFGTNVNSHSHFSDLLRVAILYQYGGVWVDLDSLFVNSITSIESEEWLPKTRSAETSFAIEHDGDKFIVEGGMMRFNKGSPFLLKVLENFPEYNEETAECWACVGPKLLTEVYDGSLRDGSAPALVDSVRVYGNSDYRNNLDLMHHEMDLGLMMQHINQDVVSFHLFTSSGEREWEDSSFVGALFASSGVKQGLLSRLLRIPLGPLSKRRNLMDSSTGTYDPPTGSPTENPVEPATDAPTDAPDASTDAPTDAPDASTDAATDAPDNNESDANVQAGTDDDDDNSLIFILAGVAGVLFICCMGFVFYTWGKSSGARVRDNNFSTEMSKRHPSTTTYGGNGWGGYTTHGGTALPPGQQWAS